MQQITWKTGTGFDLFVSLAVLHKPATFGLRPLWAAGVRQRLSPAHQVFLEKLQSFTQFPLGWLAELPGSSDAADILEAVSSIQESERFRYLTLNRQIDPLAKECLEKISTRGTWQKSDLDVLQNYYRVRDISLKHETLLSLVELWADPVGSGRQLLSSLMDYFQVFFIEEEARIRSAQADAVARGRDLASKMGIDALIEKLSQGIRFDPMDRFSRITLIPSFWSFPFIYFEYLNDQIIILYGARTENDSLVPGATPPPQLVATLKAIADPTRLRIMHILAEQPRSSSEIARELRLRLPTVVHHLTLLRLAGLIQITVGQNDKRYTTRLETLGGIQRSLEGFIKS
ncbi:MAG TPA: metalloregulator ArsR/SmtB family transcription factor [Anaerolineales bacterium]|nr:metalloregulator ArsR/SmtB family transcription factor [Anaerolineales bacterium]